jgi:hypothetical protein
LPATFPLRLNVQGDAGVSIALDRASASAKQRRRLSAHCRELREFPYTRKEDFRWSYPGRPLPAALRHTGQRHAALVSATSTLLLWRSPLGWSTQGADHYTNGKQDRELRTRRNDCERDVCTGLLLLLYYSLPRVERYNMSTSLKYEPSSELLLITAKQLFLNRVLFLVVQLSVQELSTRVPCAVFLSLENQDGRCVLNRRWCHAPWNRPPVGP